MPFQNLSGDRDQEYFSDGFTEDLITWLSHFPELVVISRGAVMPYKGEHVDPAQVRQDLGVRYVLEGSIRRPTNRVLITVQLTDAETGILLWSDRYDEVIDDLFAVQDRITRRVATTLADQIGRIERTLALAKPTDSLLAYDHLLRGWHHLGQGTRQGNEDARAEFETALDIDPNLSRAYVGLGFSYYLPIISGWTEFVDRSLTRAEEFAERALSTDSSSANAHRLRGFIHIVRGQRDSAIRALDTALQLNPSDARSYVTRGIVELFGGTPDSAVKFMESGHRLNPRMGEVAFVNLGLAYCAVGRYDEAVRTLEEASDRKAVFDFEQPVPYYRHLGLAIAHAQLGQRDDARTAAAEVRRLWPFFNADLFVAQFHAPEVRARYAEGLALAGLD